MPFAPIWKGQRLRAAKECRTRPGPAAPRPDLPTLPNFCYPQRLQALCLLRHAGADVYAACQESCDLGQLTTSGGLLPKQNSRLPVPFSPRRRLRERLSAERNTSLRGKVGGSLGASKRLFLWRPRPAVRTSRQSLILKLKLSPIPQTPSSTNNALQTYTSVTDHL